MTFKVDIDCDYRLVLDNDTIGLETPNFDFTKDILVSYGGAVYTKELYKRFCDYAGIKLPKEEPFENKTQQFGSAEYEWFYKSGTNNRLFPALNAGALLIKNDISNKFGDKLIDLVGRIPKFARKFGGKLTMVVQPVYGLAVNHITDNWYHFDKGFNLLLSKFRGIKETYEKYKGTVYLGHYINYPDDSDPLFLNIKYYHEKVKEKYRKYDVNDNVHFIDRDKIYFKSAFQKYFSGGFYDDNSISYEEVDELFTKIKNNNNFSLMRFNDGEWAFSYGIASFIESKIKKRLGYETELLESGKILKNIIESKPEYLISIDSLSKRHKDFKDIVDEKSNGLNLVPSGVFNLWCIYRGFEELFEVFNERKVLLVGPEMLEKLPFKKHHIKTKKYEGVYDLETPKNEVVEYLNKNFEENMIIVYSCSFIAKYCIDEVYKIYKTRLTQLDMGASLNPYISFNNRPWMEKIILELNEKNYFVKNKIEYNPYKQTIFE
jgi:hypothetical protein